jgi:hypothetical protein
VQRQRDFTALVGDARLGASCLFAQNDERVDRGVYCGDSTKMRVDEFG